MTVIISITILCMLRYIIHIGRWFNDRQTFSEKYQGKPDKVINKENFQVPLHQYLILSFQRFFTVAGLFLL